MQALQVICLIFGRRIPARDLENSAARGDIEQGLAGARDRHALSYSLPSADGGCQGVNRLVGGVRGVDGQVREAAVEPAGQPPVGVAE